jgi:hypothetical protein
MLHEVVTARDQSLKKGFVNEKEKHRNNGFCVITADEKSGLNNEMAQLEI